MKAFAIVSNGVAVLGLLSASAVAQQPKQTVDDLPGPLESVKELQNSARMVFMLADENNDGQISQKEARDAANLVAGGFFFRADKNGDGTLSKEEAKEARDAFLNTKPWIKYAVETVRVNAPRNAAAAGETSRGNNVDMIASFEAAFDANNDGQLQASELRQAVQTTVQAAFDQADTNRDGQLSPAELNAAVAGLSRQAALLAFREADSDNNGQISQAEFEKAILKPSRVAFEVIDLNHDGQISQQEAQTARQVVASKIRSLNFPEPANSPRNQINRAIGNPTTPNTNQPPTSQNQPAPPPSR